MSPLEGQPDTGSAKPEKGEENLLWALGIDGPGWGFKALGKDWYAVPITQGMKAFLVGWCKQTVMDGALAQQGKMPPEVFRNLISDKSDEIASERYSWGGNACLKMLQSPPGFKQLFRQLLLPKHPDVTLETVSDIIEKHTAAVKQASSQVVEHPNWEAAL